jgi:hypothetical protein
MTKSLAVLALAAMAFPLLASARDGNPVLIAQLAKTVDAKKARAGDAVTAVTLNAIGTLPKGLKILGHVDQVRPLAKGEAESVLKIVFDRAQLKDGTEVPGTFSIQAVGAPFASNNIDMATPTPSGPDRSGCPPGVDTARAAMGQMGNASPQRLTAASMGMIDLPDLKLAENAITSSKKNVRLEAGTQLVLQVVPAAK